MKDKKRNIYFTSNTVIILLTIAIIVLLLSPFLYYYNCRMESHHVLREAKNVQLSMRLLSIQEYGVGSTIADDRTVSGMKEGKESEILDLAETEGEICVQSWDEERLMPTEFTFQSGKYIVTYVKSENDEDTWTVSRYVRILTYP